MQKTLFGTYSDNCCGYCELHQCALTVKQLRAKECLGKKCWHLKKNEEHMYWRQREAIKRKKKERKQAFNRLFENTAVSPVSI